MPSAQLIFSSSPSALIRYQIVSTYFLHGAFKVFRLRSARGRSRRKVLGRLISRARACSRVSTSVPIKRQKKKKKVFNVHMPFIVK